jgi:RNA polymerase sigma-32 factor
MTKKKEDSSEFLPVVPATSREVVSVSTPDALDPFKQYLREISRHALLSREQELALTKALVETGDIEIAKKLVMHNLRLVVKIAMEYRKSYQNVMDLIQEGNIGLMKAVSKYNPEKGAKLSYYASWWIRSYILKFILDNFGPVKIGTTNDQKKLFYNLQKEKNRLIQMGIGPDVKLISENLNVSEKAVTLMEQRLEGPSDVNLDASISEDGVRALDLMPSSDQAVEQLVESTMDVALLKKHLKGFMEGLRPRDCDIFQKRLLSEIPSSLQEIGDEYGVSRERIRQIEERLLKNLKVYMSDFIR